jgi:hypothetical protein
MPKKGFNSRALRQLAVEFLRKIAQDEEFPEGEREEYVTSLVRQWSTYDGNAMLLFDDQIMSLVLSRTPLGQLCVVPQPGIPGWIKIVREAWKINPEEFPEILEQLNLRQSAEATNADGIPLRLWVNPKERRAGVEPLVEMPVRPGHTRDYRKLAAYVLEREFGAVLPVDEIETLSDSVAKQWQQYEGHACLFLDGQRQFFLKRTEKDDGSGDIVFSTRTVNLDPVLASLGVPLELIPDVIARLSLGQEVKLRDGKGIPSLLWFDPKASQVRIRALESVPPATRSSTGSRENATIGSRSTLQSVRPATWSSTPPIFCPKCKAVLQLWNGIDRQQTCPLCGLRVSLS